MKKYLLPLALIALLIFSINPTNTSAVGWGETLESNSHWGSTACTTGYPYMVFDIFQDYGDAFYHMEELSGGQWVKVSTTHHLYGNTKDSIKVKAKSSTTQYRVFVSTDWFSRTTTFEVDCRGSW